MRTTLDLPDETIRQLKELVTLLIERGLAPGAPLPLEAHRFAALPPTANAVQRYAIPIAREADGTVTPFLTNAELSSLLDDEDMARYQPLPNLSSNKSPSQ